MNKNAIQKKYIRLQGQIERISYLLNRSKQLIEESGYREYREMSSEVARLMEITTVSMRELVLETTFAKKKEQMEDVAQIHGVSIEYTGQWYKIVIPALLPNKHSGRSCMFIETPLRYAIDSYAREHKPERLRECVICFRHIYDPDFPERAIRDHDNIEAKKIQDVIADKLIVDDTGLYCSNLNVTMVGEKDATEVYVIPVGMFPEWLKMHPIE